MIHKKKEKKHRKKTGLQPGILIYTGEKKVIKPNVTFVRYNDSSIQEKEQSGERVMEMMPDYVNWYDVRGLHEEDLISSIGKSFQMHSLALEDVLNIHQRAKFEEFETGIFIILRSLDFDEAEKTLSTEQVAIYCGSGAVLSFQENETDLFSAVRDRIRNSNGKIRTKKSDYLAYSLMDVVVDKYFVVLDEIGTVVEDLEDEIYTNATQTTKIKIHKLKKELVLLRRSVSPLREAVSWFSKSDHELIDSSTKLYLRDLYDHIIQIIEMAESYRDSMSSLQDLYISEISFRMNNVMQVLTIMATIFIPLTFLAGIYGMNFDYIPELHWKYSYFVLWGVMITIFIALMFFFRKKKWL